MYDGTLCILISYIVCIQWTEIWPPLGTVIRVILITSFQWICTIVKVAWIQGWPHFRGPDSERVYYTFCISAWLGSMIVEPPNKGHFGTDHRVHCGEAVLSPEVHNEIINIVGDLNTIKYISFYESWLLLSHRVLCWTIVTEMLKCWTNLLSPLRAGHLVNKNLYTFPQS